MEFRGIAELEARLKEIAQEEAVRTVVKKHGAALQTSAQRNAPVRTGYLKRSIGLSISDGGMTATVTPTASYAPYVEFGTRYMTARPYLGPAYEAEKIAFLNDLDKLTR